jgi:ABC transporter DrrB family efflux protein
MTAATAPTPVRPINKVGMLPGTGVLALRAARIYLRTPQIVLIRVVQSVAFLLIFRYVFGGAITTGPLHYVDFMAPGLLVVGVMFASMGTGTGVAEDVAGGLYDRLRSLPMPRGAVLAGRVLADLGVTVVVLIATALIAFAVGFRVHTDWGSALAAFGITVLFGLAFVWIFVALGLAAGSVQAAQGVSFLVMPIAFASSAFVPTLSMPGWLQAFAENQPVTAVVDAVRTLTQGAPAEQLLGHDTRHYVLRALLWTIGLIIVFGGLAIARYRRR